mgnify:CR=1 FL=1
MMARMVIVRFMLTSLWKVPIYPSTWHLALGTWHLALGTWHLLAKRVNVQATRAPYPSHMARGTAR